MENKTAFYVYSSEIEAVASCITKACRQVTDSSELNITTWNESEVSGQHIPTTILENIESAEFVIADITTLSLNVIYEIGYAIGINKRVIITAHTAHDNTKKLTQKVGIFDTIGCSKYSSIDGLRSIITTPHKLNAIPTNYKKNRQMPLYLVESYGQDKNLRPITSFIKKTKLRYRSFAPNEQIRMAGIEAIENVSRSFGIILPWLNNNEDKASIHNKRITFVCGLARGMKIPTLLLQEKSDEKLPINLRDIVKIYTSRETIKDIIQDWIPSVLAELTSQTKRQRDTQENTLNKLVLGDAVAENEFDTLNEYYVTSDIFERVSRGEVGIVVGRKGAGKTALWIKLRDNLRSNRHSLILDLKPEGYQLLKLRENILNFISEGSQAHLITAFWEYILYLEIANKIIEQDKKLYFRNPSLSEVYDAIKSIAEDNEEYAESDFSERLLKVSNDLIQNFKQEYQKEGSLQLSTPQITEMLYSSHSIKDIRKSVSSYLQHKRETWILFDNLDKGWKSTGITSEDYIILRCLIDALRKIRQHLRSKDIDFNHVIFIRDDIYQILGESSPDSGKDPKISLDIQNSQLLENILYKRLQYNFKIEQSFNELWSQIAIPEYETTTTFQYMVDRSFMRPRNMLRIFNHCKNSAISRNHDKIENDDIVNGMRNYFADLLLDFDNEMSDIIPEASGFIYNFSKQGRKYKGEDLIALMDMHNIHQASQDKILTFLLYYGIIGVKENSDTDSNQATFIYNVHYNMKHLITLTKPDIMKTHYIINPAFSDFAKRENDG